MNLTWPTTAGVYIQHERRPSEDLWALEVEYLTRQLGAARARVRLYEEGLADALANYASAKERAP